MVDIYKSQTEFTAQDLDRVATHLNSRFGSDESNNKMIERVGNAISRGGKLTRAQEDFMRHELTEADLMDAGLEYDPAHEISKTAQVQKLNYDPDVVLADPFKGPWWRNAVTEYIEEGGAAE